MAAQPTEQGLHVPTHPVRIVTASALFDGHDASINIMRRIMQGQGAEVVHLGHNRSVREVVDAVLDEDAQGVAVSSYQGGHVEYFEYLVELLREAGAGHVKVVGGGGGVIVPKEIARLREAGVHDLQPGGRPAAGPARHGQPGRRRVRHRPLGRRSHHRRGGPLGRPHGRRARRHRRRDRAPRRRDARRAGPCRGRPLRARPRHHRHRRLGQVEPHRRAGPAAARGPAGQAADRLRRDRPHPPAGRRGAARRPDPDEQPRRRPRLLPSASPPGAGARCPRRSTT